MAKESKFYKIGEVAEMLDIKASTLRFWETEFPKLKPLKTSKGNRLYSEKDIDIIKEIQYLTREKGIKLSKASGKLNHHQTSDARLELIKELRNLKEVLIEIKNAL